MVDLCSADLSRALGMLGAPATLTFARDAVALITPGGVTCIRAPFQRNAIGVETVGLRPEDADALRLACQGFDGMLSLSVGSMIVALVLGDGHVTVGRW
jgi:hypothetical protein